MSDRIYITEAYPRDKDSDQVVALMAHTQRLTGIPDPKVFGPEDLEGLLYNGTDDIHLLAINEKTLAVVGHLAIKEPNPEHLDEWLGSVEQPESGRTPSVRELGGLFVRQSFAYMGVGTDLAKRGLETIRETSEEDVIPAAATWAHMPFARKLVLRLGGVELSTKDAVGGPVTLWTFPRVDIA